MVFLKDLVTSQKDEKRFSFLFKKKVCLQISCFYCKNRPQKYPSKTSFNGQHTAKKSLQTVYTDVLQAAPPGFQGARPVGHWWCQECTLPKGKCDAGRQKATKSCPVRGSLQAAKQSVEE